MPSVKFGLANSNCRNHEIIIVFTDKLIAIRVGMAVITALYKMQGRSYAPALLINTSERLMSDSAGILSVLR